MMMHKAINSIAYSINNFYNPLDTGRKLNVHKTFRRRPGRLLNVLCTFHLRPVSTGKYNPAGTRLCSNVRFWLYCDNVVFPTSLLQSKTNVLTTLCFRRPFSNLVLTLPQRRDSGIIFP